MEIISDSGEIRKEIIDVIIKKTKCSTQLNIHGAIFISTDQKTNVIHLADRVIYNEGKTQTCPRNVENTLDNYAYVSMNPYEDGLYCQPRSMSYQKTKYALVSKGLQSHPEKEVCDGYTINDNAISSDEVEFDEQNVDEKHDQEDKDLSPFPVKNLSSTIRAGVRKTSRRPLGGSGGRRYGITFECENCFLTFTRSTSLLKHKERCKTKKNEEEKSSEDEMAHLDSPTSTTSKWTTPPDPGNISFFEGNSWNLSKMSSLPTPSASSHSSAGFSSSPYSARNKIEKKSVTFNENTAVF
ncbi:DgyrCDS1085 [Dimorphilus gyrociliatus]|uniref:DgyrCDS1085 n=1 Tax=Dimorphilus gyrociliatus TaxID=2664684 RepID=A0A7I8V685_9ANNE|nr:DgyrCDS1085 [Dimorphilus gyrociliatus]